MHDFDVSGSVPGKASNLGYVVQGPIMGRVIPKILRKGVYNSLPGVGHCRGSPTTRWLATV